MEKVSIRQVRSGRGWRRRHSQRSKGNHRTEGIGERMVDGAECRGAGKGGHPEWARVWGLMASTCALCIGLVTLSRPISAPVPPHPQMVAVKRHALVDR